MGKRYISITFPEGLVQEPIFYSLVKKSGLTANIFRAKVSPSSGWLVVSLDGDEESIDLALLDLKGRGAMIVEGGEEILDMEKPPATPGIRVRLTTPQNMIAEPILAELITEFNVVVNIRHAKVDQDGGVVELAISGELSAIDQAIDSLREKGVTVAPIEGNVIE